jgi:hypothetical protein
LHRLKELETLRKCLISKLDRRRERD